MEKNGEKLRLLLLCLHIQHGGLGHPRLRGSKVNECVYASGMFWQPSVKSRGVIWGSLMNSLHCKALGTTQ